MRRLILKMSVSIDGFVAGPNGEIDWIFPSMDEGTTRWLVETISRAGAHLMGSRTFADMAAYWPRATDPIAGPMNAIPKVVFTRRGRAPLAGASTRALEDASRARPLREDVAAAAAAGGASWTEPQVAAGALADEIARLEAQPGADLLAHGGAAFARSLVREGLVDEYQLLVHPMALGAGLALFSGLAAPRALELVAVTPFPSGAVAHVYRPPGGR